MPERQRVALRAAESGKYLVLKDLYTVAAEAVVRQKLTRIQAKIKRNIRIPESSAGGHLLKIALDLRFSSG